MSNPRQPGGGDPLRPKTPKKKSRKWLWYTLLTIFGLSLGIGGVTASFIYRAYQTLPVFEDFDPSLTSTILDNKEQVVYRLASDENRTLIKDLNTIPKEVQLAIVSTEDKRFYDHFGIDIYRVFGAAWQDVKYYLGVKGAQFEGASTITMQLSRNAFLTLDQNWTRKIQEAMIAIELERRFTKDEILLRYLNQVSFGYQASGLEAAAQTYFSKAAKDLTLSEAAMLAGMLKAPSLYNPFDNYEGAMNRRAIVLELMVANGFLDAEYAKKLLAQKVELKPAKVMPNTVTFTGDWYVDYVIEILTDPTLSAKYGTPHFDPKDLYRKGLKIYTALDQTQQKLSEDSLKKIMPEAAEEYGGKGTEVPEAAVVVMNHKTGEVTAMVGGMKHEQMLKYNRSVHAYRQPGSAIKPLVAYLPAIDHLGWGPATVIDDSPPLLNVKKDDVWPKNYDPYFLGLTPMRKGVEQSINTMAVRAMEQVTPRVAIDYARKLGLSTIIDASMDPRANDENLNLALGGLTQGVNLLEMTAAYGVLGNMGMKVDPVVITRIENKYGEVIFQAAPRKQPVIKNADSVWLMVDIMKGTILRGTASYNTNQFGGWPAAGKTGTTEDWHDAWFLAFTSEIVTGVWTGYDNDQGRKSLPSYGGKYWTGAGPPTKIWYAIMKEIVKTKPADWPRPSGLTMVEVCKTSGLLPSPLCPKEETGSDWFRKGFEPKQIDNVWTIAKVVKQPWTDPKTKKVVERTFLWQEGCSGTPEERLLIKRPTEYAKHPKDEWNFDKYWPRDYTREMPKEKCTVGPAPSPAPSPTPAPTPAPGPTPPTTPPGN